MSNRLEVRLLSMLMVLDPNATAETVCECDFDRVGRVEFFNEFRLPSPVYNEMLKYVYDWFRATLGQYELLYTSDDNCYVNDDV